MHLIQPYARVTRVWLKERHKTCCADNLESYELPLKFQPSNLIFRTKSRQTKKWNWTFELEHPLYNYCVLIFGNKCNLSIYCVRVWRELTGHRTVITLLPAARTTHARSGTWGSSLLPLYPTSIIDPSLNPWPELHNWRPLFPISITVLYSP